MPNRRPRARWGCDVAVAVGVWAGRWDTAGCENSDQWSTRAEDLEEATRVMDLVLYALNSDCD